MLEECREYSTMREQVVSTAISFSRKITAFALLEELTDLQVAFCFSHEELLLMKDQNLIKICESILLKTEESIGDLHEYGLDKKTTSSFCDLLIRFKKVLAATNAAMVKEQSCEFSPVFNNVDNTYQGRLRKLKPQSISNE